MANVLSQANCNPFTEKFVQGLKVYTGLTFLEQIPLFSAFFANFKDL